MPEPLPVRYAPRVNPVRKAAAVLFLSAASILAVAVAVGGCASIRPPAHTRPVVQTMRVTGYCKCGRCCGWRRNWLGMPVVASGPHAGRPKVVGMTASGARARPGTIAADGALYPFGTVMYVEGYGFGRVEDRGGAIKGQHIDLYFKTHAEAQQWGSKTMRVYVWRER